MPDIEILDTSPVNWEGHDGTRHWVHHPHAITGRADVDDVLTRFPVVVFRPPGRDPAHTPVVIALQGMAAPLEWNAFLVPTLLDMGIACVLMDTPLAGERSLIRDDSGDVTRHLLPLSRMGVRVRLEHLISLFEAVSADLRALPELLQDRHGLRCDRLALLGVSLGCLFSSLPFTKDGLGERLLGVIGHPSLRRFAGTYLPKVSPLLTSLPARMLAEVVGVVNPRPKTALGFLALLRAIADGQASQVDPMDYYHLVNADRRVRLLVGEDDNVVSPRDAEETAEVFPDGQAYPVPGLGHGTTEFGPTFVEHVRFFVETQLGDWRG
jgi:hypothetical protein